MCCGVQSGYSHNVALICPDCKTPTLKKVIHGIEVDMCPGCGGVWLDKGEIARLRKLQTDEIRDFETAPPAKLPSRASSPACPVCSLPLHPFNYAGGKIQLETCPNLDGLWISDAQLEQIAQLSKPPPEAQILAMQQEAESDQHTNFLNRATDVLRAIDRHYGWTGIPFPWPVDQP